MRLMIITAICALLAVPALADPTVKVYQTGYSYGQGGEFSALPIGWDWNPLPLYDDSTSNIIAGTFQTFCVEESEVFYPGREYSVTFGDNAIRGGAGDAGDPISKGHEFQNQELDGYAWDTGRQLSARDLQNAIWYLEGEGGSLTQAYTDLLVAKFGSVANAQADNNGTYAVKVMSLWDLGYAGNLSHVAQDMLVCVPVPATVLLGMLGFGWVGIKLRRFV